MLLLQWVAQRVSESRFALFRNISVDDSLQIAAQIRIQLGDIFRGALIGEARGERHQEEDGESQHDLLPRHDYCTDCFCGWLLSVYM